MVTAKVLSVQETKRLAQQLHKDWRVLKSQRLTRRILFPSFRALISFVNSLAELAEKMGHHPDLEIHYTTLVIKLWTHSANGLTQKDFTLAQKIDNVHQKYSSSQ